MHNVMMPAPVDHAYEGLLKYFIPVDCGSSRQEFFVVSNACGVVCLVKPAVEVEIKYKVWFDC